MPTLYEIQGAGIAGLVLHRELQKRGIPSILQDVVPFPRHKVCGGVLQWKSWTYLKGLFDLQSEPLCFDRIRQFWMGELLSEIQLSQPMVYVSRFELDDQLFRYSYDYLSRNESQSYQKKVIDAKGTGQKKGKWIGFQAKSQNVSTLEMHYGPGLYLGLSPTGEGFAHAGILIHKKAFTGKTRVQMLIRNVLKLNIEMPYKATSWIHYGYSNNALAIGDAKMTTHPFLGLGMRHAIESAMLMAQLIDDGCLSEYDERHQRRFARWNHISHFIETTYESPLRGILPRILKNKEWLMKLYAWSHGSNEPLLRSVPTTAGS